jgi:hypothetical protein
VALAKRAGAYIHARLRPGPILSAPTALIQLLSDSASQLLRDVFIRPNV